MENFELQKMTADELHRRAGDAPAVLLPLASVEKLGAHGPVGLDLTVAQAVTPLIAKASGCLAAPAVPYGDTMEFCGMDGTVHVPPSVLEAYCYAVASSLLRSCGARAVIFLNVHSLNGHAASAVCRRLRAEGLTGATVDWWAAVGDNAKDLLADWENGRGHGGEMITSVALALAGDSVDMEQAACETAAPGLHRVTRWNGTPFCTYGNFPQYCRSGAWGDTCTASAQKGKALIERGVAATAQFILKEFQR